MIFWFSGTGNSKWAAEEIGRATGDRLIQMTSYADSSYELAEGESVGFVFPVYWYGLPVVVGDFLNRLQILNYHRQYTYAVVTYGIAAGHIMKMLDKQLTDKNFVIRGRFGVKMIDNYVVGYDVPNVEKITLILTNAKEKMNEITRLVIEKSETEYLEKGLIGWVAPVTYYFYRQTNHAKNFWTDQNCTGCGKCERECPTQAIHIESGKPVWTNSCAFCLKCLNSCPVQAVQYKKGTVNRGRYRYPGTIAHTLKEVKKK